MFVYFLLFFSLVFSTPLPRVSRFDSRDGTKRRERKMRLWKNFNGAKVMLETTTRKTTTTRNLFPRRRCFCSSSARKCSPRTKIIISKRGGGGVPQIRGLLRVFSSSSSPSKDKSNSNDANNTNAWNCSTKTTDRTFSETDTICGNRSNEI